MSRQKVRVQILRLKHAEDFNLPEYATDLSAGMDLSAAVEEPMMLNPGERFLVSTGISIALPEGYEAQIRPRSGLALKHGVTVLNAPGTIDADYRGELKVILINLSDKVFVVEKGLRIAQMVLCPVVKATLKEVTELENTERGSSGFGSTGIK